MGPLVVLHDHLDGGLRPATLAELARDAGHADLPHGDLGQWYAERAWCGSLAGYLEGFDHTVAVLQTEAALERVAREAADDLAADGVAYAELRFAPLLHTSVLRPDQVVAAVLRGLGGAPVRLLLCALRHRDESLAVAELALRWWGRGVVGLDLAGPEAGFPVQAHAEGLGRARDAGLPITVHAGEADGPGSVLAAIRLGATRIGHGVRLAHDLGGEAARAARDLGTVLELCPTSNAQTGAWSGPPPLEQLLEAGLQVCLNSDNRLVSATSASAEHAAVGGLLARRCALTAAGAAFCDDAERRRLVAEVAHGWDLARVA